MNQLNYLLFTINSPTETLKKSPLISLWDYSVGVVPKVSLKVFQLSTNNQHSLLNIIKSIVEN